MTLQYTRHTARDLFEHKDCAVFPCRHICQILGKESLFMNGLTEMLAQLGQYTVPVLIGCVELIAAVLLLGLPRVRRSRRPQPVGFTDLDRLLLRELSRQQDEVCLVLRCADLMPLTAMGDLEGMLGVTLPRLREDLESLLHHMAGREKSLRFWRAYRGWDGRSRLTAQLETDGGRWLYISIHRSQDGAVDLLLFRDVTEQHRREEGYQQRLRDAEAASQFKSSFLFRMSHEIRTPMNGITGMLTLAEGKLAPDHPAMQYLTRADELSEHLLSLINDILDMSRIEAGKVELEAAPFSLRALGGRLWDMFSKTLDAKGVRFAVNFEDMTVDWVVGDELRIGQVVINFLSNAVKFTSRGEVTVTFRQMMLRENTVDLMVRVHDTGVGMDPEFIDRIFRPFEQEDASTTRRFGGTGLGMAISDQLVKLMGGQIVVESVKGVGSDFSVILSLPVAAEDQRSGCAARQAEEAPEPVPDRLPCRILMAEDNEVNAMITVELLSQHGVQLDVAENGLEAVDRFSAAPAGTYDMILMDVQMPVMDGRTAARTIRALPRDDAKIIPIYALSADAFVEDERLSRESGMDGHLTKPIDYPALLRIIQRALRGKEEHS